MAMQLHSDTRQPQRRSFRNFSFWLMVLGCFGIAWMVLQAQQDIAEHYASVATSEETATAPVASYRFENGQTLHLPTSQVMQAGEPLGLVSATRPLPADYKPDNLVPLRVPHGDSGLAMRVQHRLQRPLDRLFTAADKAGYPLMISSAYRSIADQSVLYEQYVAKYGQAVADTYVADPRTSEHHTGLAVDFSDASEACLLDSDSCNLSPATAAWLEEYAPNYGFILRYPDGKQAITGVGYEPWHYRYVGVTPARLLSDQTLTFDELIREIQPGLFK